MSVRTLSYILVMAGVTYLIRMLPLTLIRRQIRSPFIRSFLYYVPYVTLSVMTFPSILTATFRVPGGLRDRVHPGAVPALIGAAVRRISRLTAALPLHRANHRLGLLVHAQGLRNFLQRFIVDPVVQAAGF